MIWLVSLALARDVDVKVHDMDGTLTGSAVVQLTGPGGQVRVEACDDGSAPDAVAGDHLFTARAEGLALENGEVVVTGRPTRLRWRRCA